MYNKDIVTGVVEATKAEDNVGRVDMWGDRVVGSIPVDKPEEPSLDRGIVHIEKDIYLHPDCELYRHTGSRWEKLKRYNGRVYATRSRGYNLARLVAENYIPNPMGLPYIRKLDGDWRNTHITNLRWTSCREKGGLRKIAIVAERAPGFYQHILNPVYEVPEIITVKSTV